MPTEYRITRSFSDTAFVEEATAAQAERERVSRVLAPQRASSGRKVVSYKGTTPLYQDEQTFLKSLFAPLK